MGRDLTHAEPSSPLDRFLFAGIDARVAAVFRVLLAIMLAWVFESHGMRVSSRFAGSPIGAAWYADVWLSPLRPNNSNVRPHNLSSTT